MKTRLFVWAALVGVVAANSALAQNTGTIQVLGSVQPSAAIRWSDYSPINSETGTNAVNVWNAPLDFTLNLSDLAAGNNLNDYAGGSVQAVLRANAGYSLSAQISGTSGFGSVAAGDLALSDVGFGVSGLANSGTGALVQGNPAADATIAGAFGNDPGSAAKDVDEQPTFATTLADVAASTQVLSGPRISKRGGRGSPNNGLLLDLGFAVGPQYYSPVATFSADVQFTLATP